MSIEKSSANSNSTFSNAKSGSANDAEHRATLSNRRHEERNDACNGSTFYIANWIELLKVYV